MAALESIPRRIVLTGSESTGKSTLAEALARQYGTVWVPEYVRQYAAAKGAPLDAGDVETIARGQMALQDAATAAGAGLILFDTDLLSTTVYAEHYYGRSPDWIAEALQSRRGDLYLLCGIDVPWTADPQRDRPHERELMQGLFLEALVSRQFPFRDIRGSPGERLELARAAIDGLLIS